MPACLPACIPFDPEGHHCLAGLLLGVACCPDGTCALCRADLARRRRLGLTEAVAQRRAARERARRLAQCPACGCPPPPPLQELPQLPRLDRSTGLLGGEGACRYCGNRLLHTRRKYCNDSCWNAYLTESRRSERSESRSHRVARV